MLRRLIRMVRATFPRARIRVRLDGGFASPALFEFLKSEPKVEYVVAMASNAVLKVSGWSAPVDQSRGRVFEVRTDLRSVHLF